jgi:cytidylate kinase
MTRTETRRVNGEAYASASRRVCSPHQNRSLKLDAAKDGSLLPMGDYPERIVASPISFCHNRLAFTPGFLMKTCVWRRDIRFSATGFLMTVIAIDGPAAAGKGTLSRLIAKAYGFHHLDTGLTYRAVAKALLDAHLPLDDEAVAADIARNIELAGLDRTVLSAHDIGEAASKIAVMAELRKALVEAQRTFARRKPGAVLDGRDIGTVVCPDAEVKLYITASPEVRAGRRHEEILANGGTTDFDTVLADIRKRDARDMGRADSPLKPAEDAHLIDTSEMGIEAAFQAAKVQIDAVLERDAFALRAPD